MTRFDKSLFLNNTLNYLRQFGYQAIPSEVKYNLTKGLTAYFLVTSVKNSGNSYISLLSRAQDYLNRTHLTSNKTDISHELLTTSIKKVLDIQKPLDVIKRYQDYHASSSKIDRRGLGVKQSLATHRKADVESSQHFKKYSDSVHQLAEQYFNALKNKALKNVDELDPSLNKVLFKKLLSRYPNNLSKLITKSDKSLIEACFNTAAEQMRCPKLKQYDQFMAKNGFITASETELSYFFQIKTPVEIKLGLREDARQAETGNKETGIQIFAGKDTLAAYIRKNPADDVTTFTLFDPNVGVEKFYSIDAFLTTLISKAKAYNLKNDYSDKTLKYKKFYYHRPPAADQEQTATHRANLFAPSAPPLPFEPSAPPEALMAEDTVGSTCSAVPPSYGELFLGDKSPLALHDAHLSGQHNAPAPPYALFSPTQQR